jgi:hypothetical protein
MEETPLNDGGDREERILREAAEIAEAEAESSEEAS